MKRPMYSFNPCPRAARRELIKAQNRQDREQRMSVERAANERAHINANKMELI